MRSLLLAILGLAVVVPSTVRACTIPVFRYALEKWDLTPAEVLVFHKGALPKDLDEALTQYGAAPHKLNLDIKRIDLAGTVAPKLLKLWEREGKKDQGPWMLIRYAGMDPSEPSAFNGPCSLANLKSIADSPVRQAILAHLSRGSIVWLQVTSDDRQADEAVHALLKKELTLLEKKIKLPVQSDTGPKIQLPLPLKTSFTLLVLDRTRPEEAGFLQLLMGTEERLAGMKGPMVFPIFGRGRVLGSLIKKEISEEQIMDVTKFLCRECSCQIKDLNPGLDMVMSADWRKMFDRLYEKKDAMEMPKDVPLELPAALKKSSLLDARGYLAFLPSPLGGEGRIPQREGGLMFARSPALTIVGGSALLLAVMIGALYWISRPTASLELYCAAAMIKPIQLVADDYEKAFGQPVVLHPGPSQAILNQLEMSKEGDLFLPADESYMKQAQDKGLVDTIKNVADLQAVLIVRPGFGKDIKTWTDFIAVGKRIGIANPGAAAISSITEREFKAHKLWDAFRAAEPTYLGDVNEVGNSVANTGSSDVGITWEPLANALIQKKPGVKIVRLKELDPIKARVQIAVAKSSQQSANALRFIAFLRDKDKGAVHLTKAGYAIVADE